MESGTFNRRIEEVDKMGTNSTLTMMTSSKSSDWETTQTITNMKMVCENKIKSLEEAVKERNREISRLNRAMSQTRRTHQSPRAHKVCYLEKK